MHCEYPSSPDRASGEVGMNLEFAQPRVRPHEPEPEPGSVLTGDGRHADLFNLRHYPVRALCRLCGEPIKAQSFLRPFKHDNGPDAETITLPAPRA